MQTPEVTPATGAAHPRLIALFAWMRRHWKAVHTVEIIVFSLMILLQLAAADMLLSWHGWAIAMFGALFGIALTLRFPANVDPATGSAAR